MCNATVDVIRCISRQEALMAGHRSWKHIRGAADEDQERRRRVEAGRREVEEEQRTYAQSRAQQHSAHDRCQSS